MKIFILIIVISSGSQTGKTVVQQEFNSLNQCEYVRSTLVSQINQSTSVVTAQGCFEK